MNFQGVVALSLFISVVATNIEGKRWAILVAGSNGYDNYRHQANVCHAYQVLKKGGLDDDNIIVFMYDDIAFNIENPRPGILINKPYGNDVYQGVPKDYSGENVTAANFYAVILGKKSALTGGSGKVLESGPDDYVFIYYTDHGGAGAVGMPNGVLYAKDFIDVLKKKHEANAYKNMVIYIEACESGSMFEGLLPENWNIYGVTSSNASQDGYATYCTGYYPSSPSEYDTCLADVFSVSWLEHSDRHDMRKETLAQQYQLVRRRTGFDTFDSSPVMQYGDKSISRDFLFNYIGTNPENDNFTATTTDGDDEHRFSFDSTTTVNQRDVRLFYLRKKFEKAPKGSQEKVEAKKKLFHEISHRKQVDRKMRNIGALLLGQENGLKVLDSIRPSGQPLVDDWDCLKMLVKVYEEHCGSLSPYGRKYTRVIANMCNVGINKEKLIMALKKTCFADNPIKTTTV